MPSLSRRRFLEISTAAAGVGAVGGIPAFAHGVLSSSETLRTVPTTSPSTSLRTGSPKAAPTIA
jgi:hypothetical protein